MVKSVPQTGSTHSDGKQLCADSVRHSVVTRSNPEVALALRERGGKQRLLRAPQPLTAGEGSSEGSGSNFKDATACSNALRIFGGLVHTEGSMFSEGRRGAPHTAEPGGFAGNRHLGCRKCFCRELNALPPALGFCRIL